MDIYNLSTLPFAETPAREADTYRPPRMFCPNDKAQHQTLARKLTLIMTTDVHYNGVVGAYADGGLIYLTHGIGGPVIRDLFPTEANEMIAQVAVRLQKLIHRCC